MSRNTNIEKRELLSLMHKRNICRIMEILSRNEEITDPACIEYCNTHTPEQIAICIAAWQRAGGIWVNRRCDYDINKWWKTRPDNTII